MKSRWKIAVLLTTCAGSLGCLGQGGIFFENLSFPFVDAPVTFADGRRITSGFKAELFGAPVGTPLDRLVSLEPMTSFRTNMPGYINGVSVNVPGVRPAQRAIVVMRAFNGTSWAESECRGESQPLILTVGGSALPPATLVGLQPFHVYCRANVQLDLKGDHAQLTWAATNQQPYTVQAVSNITDTNWVPLLTITPTNQSAIFTEPISLTNSSPRFYRVVSP